MKKMKAQKQPKERATKCTFCGGKAPYIGEHGLKVRSIPLVQAS